MEQYKFRAWNQDTQEFEYLILAPGGRFSHSKLVSFSANAIKDWQQYTCLKDRNGDDIIEGDIVRWDGENMEVYWGWGAWAVKAQINWSAEENAPVAQYLGEFDSSDIEVVGNVNQHPDLVS